MASDEFCKLLLVSVTKMLIPTEAVTIISDSITAYSTAVGPSSSSKNRWIDRKKGLWDMEMTSYGYKSWRQDHAPTLSKT